MYKKIMIEIDLEMIDIPAQPGFVASVLMDLAILTRRSGLVDHTMNVEELEEPYAIMKKVDRYEYNPMITYK